MAPTGSLDVLNRGKPLVFAGNQNKIYVSSSHSTMRDFRLPLDP